MKILIISERFFPSIGGVETVTRVLAEAFVSEGHAVCVATREGSIESDAPNFEVVRRPGLIRLLRLYARAEAIILQGPAVRLGWLAACRKNRALMVHHMVPLHRTGVNELLRRGFASKVRHGAVSMALASMLPWPVEVVLPNPYDDLVFYVDAAVRQDRGVVFVGRLIPEKGARVLLEALSALHQSGVPITATFVGAGPESARLKQFIDSRGLKNMVRMTGTLTGADLARLLRQHQILVVPSICPEGFGVVALEAIACGCAVVGSDIGGLPEAIGPCGVTFPAGDAQALADRLKYLLHSAAVVEKYRASAVGHLKPHRPAAVAQAYLQCSRVLPFAAACDFKAALRRQGAG